MVFGTGGVLRAVNSLQQIRKALIPGVVWLFMVHIWEMRDSMDDLMRANDGTHIGRGRGVWSW
jgi:hypothetical protein